MKAKPRFSMMTVTMLMVLVVSTIWVVPVFADDSTPPPPVDTPTEVVPAVDEPTATDVPAEEVTAPVEAASTEVVPEAVAPDMTITEVLTAAPDGTDVQVVDGNGESLPLASQEAADVVAGGDPIWCPVGVTPKSGVGGCTTKYLSFQDLIDDLLTAGGVTNPAKAGVIWIESTYNTNDVLLDLGNDPGVTSFTLDGAVLSNMALYALTIKGGWSGAANTVTNPSTPSLFNGASLSIVNWSGNITVSDIVFDGATTSTSSEGSNIAALHIETSKNIQLDRVVVKNTNSSGSSMNGATLDNTSSTVASTVVVNNSAFENNEGDGLNIQSAGVVTITGLFANGNDGSGAVIDTCQRDPGANPDPLVTEDDFCIIAGADKAVTLKGSLQFNNNAGAGLTVSSKGLITISNIMAAANGSNGVNLNNTLSATNQGVTINGTNSFVSNAIGLNIRTHGNLLANNISAIDNVGGGAYIDNCDVRLPDGACLVLIAKTLKLTGYNYFNNNGGRGLELYSFGAITVSNLTASGNDFSGALLDNERPNNALVQVDSIGTITLTGYGIFNDNLGNGLETNSHGNIVLTNLSANGNSNNGVKIRAQRTNIGTKVYIANVTLTGLNSFNKNGVDGLHVDADGKITLAGITASYNIAGDGAELNTTEKGYGVTLTGTNTFLENGSNGLLVVAYGAISVANLTANGNGALTPAPPNGSGAILDNCRINLGLCNTTTAYAVTLTGYANASDNFYRGLQIDSLGAITLSNVLASDNLNVGVRIQNQYNPTFNKAIVRGVTLKGTNTFYNNDSTGLVVLSYGAITLNSINANNNGDDSPGTTSGAYLNNEIAPGVVAKNITMTGVNSFVGNYKWGLEFHSNGIVSLTRLNANGNDWDDANGQVGGGVLGTAKTITITCGHMFGNGKGTGVGVTDPGIGYSLTATGVLTFKGIYSSGNNGNDVQSGSSIVTTKACALP